MKYGILILSIFLTTIYSRDFRVQQMPSTKFSCVSCHVNWGGNPNLTALGEDALNTLDGVNVDWERLAALDSDGDGATNGEEFGDPDGNWVIGDPFVDDELVTNPNDPKDFPTSVEASDYFENINIGPNPSTNNMNISFEQKKPNFTKLGLYDLNGNLIELISNEYKGIGVHTLNWHHNLVPSTYLIVISQKDVIISKKVIVN